MKQFQRRPLQNGTAGLSIGSVGSLASCGLQPEEETNNYYYYPDSGGTGDAPDDGGGTGDGTGDGGTGGTTDDTTTVSPPAD